MRFKFLLILLFFSCATHAQEYGDPGDTLIDYEGAFGDEGFGRLDRFVKEGDRVFYFRNNYRDTPTVKNEYFRVDDSSFYVLGYARNGKLSYKGRVKIHNKVIGGQEIATPDSMDPSILNSSFEYYIGFIRTGYWTIYDSAYVYQNCYWCGEYSNNQKIGIWRKYFDILGVSMELETEVFDGSVVLPFNLVGHQEIKTINKTLLGKWHIYSCEDNISEPSFLRQEEGVNLLNIDFEFQSKSRLNYSFSGLCWAPRDKKYKGSWVLIESQGNTYLKIKDKDNKESEYQVLYLDDKNMLLKRVK